MTTMQRACAAIAAAALLAPCGAVRAAEPAAARPNVLLILADDKY